MGREKVGGQTLISLLDPTQASSLPPPPYLSIKKSTSELFELLKQGPRLKSWKKSTKSSAAAVSFARRRDHHHGVAEPTLVPLPAPARREAG